jgi:predicted nucleic acid-binding Zn ribbon protein
MSDAGEAAADLEPLAAGIDSIALARSAVELVEDRLAPAGRHAAGDRLDHAAKRLPSRRAGVDARSSRRATSGIGQRVDVASTSARSPRHVDRARPTSWTCAPSRRCRRRTGRATSARDRARRRPGRWSRGALARPPPSQARMPYFAW